jgi:hypothetical protein
MIHQIERVLIMPPTSGWQGQLLQTALQEPPQLVLTFYSYGILMCKALGDGTYTEYPVDAAHIAQALAAKVRFDTGLLNNDVLLVRREGLRELVVGYRRPQKTGLILLRTTSGGSAQYQLYAVKRRPTTLRAPLYHAPLPNVFNSGSICWGNVALTPTQGTSLSGTWQDLFGSPFGNHAVSGKSAQYRQDIRQHLLALAENKTRTYPTRDLVTTEKTLEQIVDWGRYHD